MRAELDAIVCSGAMRGRQHTYALLDERAPQAKTLEYEAARAELTRRYFASRGPATVNDFLRWSSLTAGEGREGLALVANELESHVVDCRTYWFGPGSRVARTSSKPTVDPVEGYDEIIMLTARAEMPRLHRGPATLAPVRLTAARTRRK
jgi:hypothetical protein